MSTPNPTAIYQLCIRLDRISPLIWCRLLVTEATTIAELHAIIQIAFGWFDSRLHRFLIHGKSYGIAYLGGMCFDDYPDQLRLADFRFRAGERFTYEYNFHVPWRHEIRVEQILSPAPDQRYPICSGGARAVPPEECGGPDDFLALRQQYHPLSVIERLLSLIDARGHGASDKPHDPAAYALPLRVADVVAVLDHLTIQHAHFFGYSMGAWIGFGLAHSAPERVRTLILGGAHPYAESFEARQTMLAQGRDAFLTASERAFGAQMTPARRARLEVSDLQALCAQTQDREDISAVLPTMRMPCCLFAGEQEPRFAQIQACVQRLPEATFFMLAKSGVSKSMPCTG